MFFKLISLKYDYFLCWSCIPAQQWLKILIIKNYFSITPANFSPPKIWIVFCAAQKFFKLWKNAGDLEFMAVWVTCFCVSHNHSLPLRALPGIFSWIFCIIGIHFLVQPLVWNMSKKKRKYGAKHGYMESELLKWFCSTWVHSIAVYGHTPKGGLSKSHWRWALNLNAWMDDFSISRSSGT
jgi:hypothetical protein